MGTCFFLKFFILGGFFLRPNGVFFSILGLTSFFFAHASSLSCLKFHSGFIASLWTAHIYMYSLNDSSCIVRTRSSQTFLEWNLSSYTAGQYHSCNVCF